MAFLGITHILTRQKTTGEDETSKTNCILGSCTQRFPIWEAFDELDQLRLGITEFPLHAVQTKARQSVLSARHHLNTSRMPHLVVNRCLSC